MAETPPELLAEIHKLERKHAEHPEGRYFVPLANAYRKAGQLGRAESLLRDGLRRHPEYLSAHIVLGRCLADGGAAREAAEEFRYVLSLDPQNLIALRSLGDLALVQGHTDEAVRWYDELLRADPMNEDARRALDSLRAHGASTEPAADSAAYALEPEPRMELDPGLDELPVLQPSDDDLVLTDPMGWTSDSAAARTGDPGRLDDADLYGEIADPDPADDLPAFDEGPELVTETIAELYARQGLYDRAADVYRELIRRRGEDAGLQRRLAEVERLAAGDGFFMEPTPEPTAEAAAPAPFHDPGEDIDAADFWLSGFNEDLPIGPAVVEDERVSAYEEAAVSEEPLEPWAPAPPTESPASQTIAQFLTELASWRPREAHAEPAAAPFAAAEDVGEPLLPDGTGTAEDAPMPLGQPDSPVPDAVAEGADEFPPFPDEPVGTVSTDAEVGAGPAGGHVLSEQPAEAPRPPESSSRARVLDDDDDDLESFQAWLRSLKR